MLSRSETKQKQKWKKATTQIDLSKPKRNQMILFLMTA